MAQPDIKSCNQGCIHNAHICLHASGQDLLNWGCCWVIHYLEAADWVIQPRPQVNIQGIKLGVLQYILPHCVYTVEPLYHYELIHTGRPFKDSFSKAVVIMRSPLLTRASISLQQMAKTPRSKICNSILSQVSRSMFSSQKIDDKTDKSKQSSQNPSHPAFSFEGLGISPKLKIVVLGAIAVIGTMETIFWVKLGWAKISPSSEE